MAEEAEKKKQKEKQTRPQRIVRILATDIDSSLPVLHALRRIKGISFMFSNAVCANTSIDKNRSLDDLSADEIKSVESFVRKPEVPNWLLNRRKHSDGTDTHMTMAELALQKREDINRLRRIRAYRGIRHELGLPMRGQRTRSTFRTQKAVGVSKKKQQQKAKGKKK